MTDRNAIRNAMLDDALRNGNSVEHATDLAEAFIEVYDEAARVAALPGGEFPRPSSLVLAKHAQLHDRLTDQSGSASPAILAALTLALVPVGMTLWFVAGLAGALAGTVA